nr:MAG TPA: hypothetical protein [Crassvirales sp.]
MKQFEKKSIPTEEVKYSVEFPTEEKYMLRKENSTVLYVLLKE